MMLHLNVRDDNDDV